MMPKFPTVYPIGQTLPTYIGVDPGQSGGLVALYSGVATYQVMPDTELGVWQTLRDWRSPNCQAVIEKVHSMPKQGVASSFTFGWGYGGLRMALIAASIPFSEVTPQAWQKGLGIPPRQKSEEHSAFKRRLLAFAQQQFPELPLWSEPRSKGKQLAICDALLIALYCKRLHQQG
jgi:crossover junction endodeoxyribonuclease RuvC